jgi:hypothetical protein
MHKETSPGVSSIAARHMNISAGYIGGLTPEGHIDLAQDVRTLAASALGQDEHRGQEPETFVDRLHREFNELQDRLQKLSAFLIRGAPGVKDDQRELLNMQLDAMRLYHAVLKLRLLDLPPPNKDQGKLALASEENIGEPVQTGGHDHVRDGDPDFNA